MPTAESNMPSSISMPLALQRLFYKLQSGENSVATEELTKSFGWDTQDSFMQHDVQEFNRVLCEKLEHKMQVNLTGVIYELYWCELCNDFSNWCLQGTLVEGTIQMLFEGNLINFINCINVDYESSKKEKFYGTNWSPFQEFLGVAFAVSNDELAICDMQTFSSM